jgi:hypothetical protein
LPPGFTARAFVFTVGDTGFFPYGKIITGLRIDTGDKSGFLRVGGKAETRFDDSPFKA